MPKNVQNRPSKEQHPISNIMLTISFYCVFKNETKFADILETHLLKIRLSERNHTLGTPHTHELSNEKGENIGILAWKASAIQTG